MKRNAVILVVMGTLVAIWYWKRKGVVEFGTPTVKAGKGVKFVDPCPGDHQLWVAEVGRCMTFEESEAFDAAQAMTAKNNQLVS